ncbi:uncharacterized protein LOC135676249 [Musa acuminata AAA Group]|uniref:uncharacterized protein LOC135676249 n=1 Tax=Musa acuminata AAA Group TaxID=214697 RepID=UPI0031D0ADF4
MGTRTRSRNLIRGWPLLLLRRWHHLNPIRCLPVDQSNRVSFTGNAICPRWDFQLSAILGYVMTASFVKVLALASLALTSISGYRIRWLCHGEEFVCCRIKSTLEISSSVQQDCMALQSSDMFQPTNAGQIGSSNADPSFINVDNNRSGNFIFHTGNVCPTVSLSLSNLTGESSAADYQDRGVSPTFLTGESTWDSNLEPGRPQARNEAKMRYNEKKKSHCSGNKLGMLHVKLELMTGL